MWTVPGLCTQMLPFVLQGCLKHAEEGGNAVYEKLQEVKGDIIMAGLKFNKITHALFVEVHLMANEIEVMPPCTSPLHVLLQRCWLCMNLVYRSTHAMWCHSMSMRD